jgi:molecular chaperone DnaK
MTLKNAKIKKSTKNEDVVIIGIDSGTTYVKVARVLTDGRIEVVRVNGKDWQLETAIFLGEDRTEFGQRATNMAVSAPERYMIEFKRQFGEFDDQGNALVMYVDPKSHKEYSAVDLAALYLGHVKETVEKTLNASIGGVVISCPAHFKDPARRQVQEAGEAAGFNVLGIIDEPVSAAMAYFAETREQGTFIVFDLGGGTLDVTIIEATENGIKVRATDGDCELGGCDFDLHLRQHVLKLFAKDQGFSPDPVEDAQDLQEVLLKTRQARHDLSDSDQVSLPIRIRANQMVCEITRTEFNKLTQGTVDKAIAIAKRALEKAKLNPKDIDAILLVGGATHMPCIPEAVESSFGVPVRADEDREFLVAKGAALQAVRLGADDKELADIVKELPVSDIVVSNKTAHPLCITIVGSKDSTKSQMIHHPMIPEQSDIPASVTDRFAPAEDYQSGVKIEVTQGNPGETVKANDVVYSLDLAINRLPRAQRKDSIEVTYTLDAESMIHVHGKDLIGGNEAEGRFSLNREADGQAA